MPRIAPMSRWVVSTAGYFASKGTSASRSAPNFGRFAISSIQQAEKTFHTAAGTLRERFPEG